jgi:hypothetical protein
VNRTFSRQQPTLDYRAISPSQEDILGMFSEYLAASHDGGTVVPIAHSFGAVRLPEQLPLVAVSIDFCEVLRQTGRTCGSVMGTLDVEYPYVVATGLSEVDTTALVRALMKTNQIPPAPDTAALLHILQAIRAKGGLVIGNTSTLAGCEEATLKFITKHYPGAFDGVNFNTGGHSARGSTRTKAQAIHSILLQIDPSYARPLVTLRYLVLMIGRIIIAPSKRSSSAAQY